MKETDKELMKKIYQTLNISEVYEALNRTLGRLASFELIDRNSECFEKQQELIIGLKSIQKKFEEIKGEEYKLND